MMCDDSVIWLMLWLDIVRDPVLMVEGEIHMNDG